MPRTEHLRSTGALLGLVGTAATGILALPSAVEARQEVHMNRTIETLEPGHPVFGLFTANLSLQNARALANSQLDFLFIDMEHSPFDMEKLQTFLLGMVESSRGAWSVGRAYPFPPVSFGGVSPVLLCHNAIAR